MERIKTKSFELAMYAKGNESAEKLALLLPGQLDTKDYPHMRSHVDFLADRGFFALSFDPPGTWESPGDISLYTMTNYFKAVNELIEHFGGRPTLTMGHSRGGGLAILAGIRNPHVFAFVAVMSNYTWNPDKNTLYQDEEWKRKGLKDSWRDLPEDPTQKKFFQLPYTFAEDSKEYDLLDELRRCTKPKLFFLGKRDPLVKPETVKVAYDAAVPPKQLYELDSDHNYRWHSNLIEEVNRVVGGFIEKLRV